MNRFLHLLNQYRLLLLLIVSTFVRFIIANSIELGNDEVYYISYALYPDLSHFDHPPMVGWIIQLFTFNLALSNDIYIRLGAVVCGTISTWLIYLIGKNIGDKTIGWYSALLYTFSLYGFIITGIFIMPDSPQLVFWLLTILFVFKAVDAKSYHVSMFILLAGVSGGLAMLSKYTSIFILFGLIVFFLKDRQWLSKWYVYLAMLIAFILFLPVVYWNMTNDFISFTFHTDRVTVSDSLINFKYFAKELFGQMIYNNPVNYILLIFSLVFFYKNKKTLVNKKINLLFYISFPLILTFLLISLFRSTLPHWTGPAFITLIPVIALWLQRKVESNSSRSIFPWQVFLSALFLLIVVSGAYLQISRGVFLHKGIDSVTGKRLGIKDITLDMYGWKELGSQFKELYHSDTLSHQINDKVVIISHRWFPAANIDHYVARPLGVDVLTIGSLERTHKYAWITSSKGGLNVGMDAYFISSSYDFADPLTLYADYFQDISTPDTIPIYRNNILVNHFYIWRMKDLVNIPPPELTGENLSNIK